MRRSGVGDTLSNLSAIADWRLAGRERGEEVDGVAVTFAQTAALAVLHRADGIDDEEFLMALADALVLSGLAMATAGSSRPCSGAEHEIVHAIDHLFPEQTPNHGELAGAAALFATWLRGDERQAAALDACLTRHGLPRLPADLGLSEEQFCRGRAGGAQHAPRPLHDPRAPRPGRGGGAQPCPRVPRGLRSLSCGRPRSRPASSSATAASTGPGGSTSGASRPT